MKEILKLSDNASVNQITIKASFVLIKIGKLWIFLRKPKEMFTPPPPIYPHYFIWWRFCLLK